MFQKWFDVDVFGHSNRDWMKIFLVRPQFWLVFQKMGDFFLSSGHPGAGDCTIKLITVVIYGIS
jgi:hypothetical protein